MLPRVDIMRCDIPQALMITLVIVVLDEFSDCLFQLTRHIIRQEADITLDRTVISFNLAVGFVMSVSADSTEASAEQSEDDRVWL